MSEKCPRCGAPRRVLDWGPSQYYECDGSDSYESRGCVERQLAKVRAEVERFGSENEALRVTGCTRGDAPCLLAQVRAAEAEVQRLRLLLDKVHAEFVHFPSLDEATLTNREALARVERHWPEGEAAKEEKP